jgi:hypothetical protein
MVHRTSHSNSSGHDSDEDVVRAIARELPAAFEVMPPDVLVGFLNVLRGSKRRVEETVSLVRSNLEWSASVPYQPYAIADCMSPPERRVEFEAIYAAGPVGEQRDTHRTVVLEKIGAVPPRGLCKAFTVAEMIRQTVYNRQAAFAWTRASSWRHGHSLRKVSVIVDLQGFSLAHLSSEFAGRIRAYIKTLQNLYPEAADGFYVINAPVSAGRCSQAHRMHACARCDASCLL